MSPMDTPLPSLALEAPAEALPFPETHEPGIYFGLPEDEYHADPSFSSSGIKQILVSNLTFWVNSWMNPNKPPQRESEALDRGKAYHKFILEGEEAFNRCYAVAPDKGDYPGVLDTMAEMKAYAAKEGIGVKGTTKADIAASIRKSDVTVPLWHEIVAEFEAERGEREEVSAELYAQLRLGKVVIANMPEVKNAFTDGRSEVSIFWRRMDGVPMKCRIDYLNRSIIDLKSFANILDKEIREAVAGEIARNRYQIQPAVYRDGVEAMKALYRQHGAAIVRKGDFDEGWLERVMTNRGTRFFFAFIRTGHVPDFIVREYGEFYELGGNGMTPNEYWRRSRGCYAEGIRRYLECMRFYGVEPDRPWLSDFGLRQFTDQDFPLWFLQGKETE